MPVKDRFFSAPEKEIVSDTCAVKIFSKPIRLLALTLASIFIAEGAIMLLMHHLPSINGPALGIIDALLLSLLAYPVLHFSLFSPMKHHLAERDRAETSLRQSQESLRSVIEASRDGMILTDSYGKITMANPAAEEMFERSKQDLTGQSLSALLSKEQHDHFERLMESQSTKFKKANPPSEPTEFLAFRRDGNEFPIEFLLSSGENAGKPFILAIVRDITERKKREQLASLGMTAGELVHSIKNIQTRLVGSVGVFEKALETGDHAMVVQTLSIMKRAVMQMNELVLNMLVVSKNRELQKESINLNDLVQEIVEDCRVQATTAGVQLVKELRAELPNVEIDRLAFYNSILNLVSNALVALQGLPTKDRKVCLRTAHDHKKGIVSLSVEDNGLGIPPELKQVIFEPFFSTKSGNHAGLGLAVVKKVVDEHYGRLLVESELGKGSVFTIELKLANPNVKVD